MEEVFRECVSEERSRGRTVLLSSHILSEVEALCDRVTIIRAGRTVETGTLSELRHLTRITIEAETLDGQHVVEHVEPGELQAVLEKLVKHGREVALEPPADARGAVPEALPVTNVWILVGLALKRDRVMIPAWLLGLAAAVAVTASSYSSLYATEASRREVVQTLGTTPATLALYGRIYADSVGGLVAWRVGGIALALAGLMSILLVVRHTRAEEETGRAELIGAGVVGRNAPLAAALITAGLTSLALGGCVVLALLATGLGLTGSLALGAVVRRRRPRVRGHRRGDGAGRRVRARRQRARGRRSRRGLRAAGDRRRRPALGRVAVAARLGPGAAPVRGRALVGARAPARAGGAR